MHLRPLQDWYHKFSAFFHSSTPEQRFWNWFQRNERRLFQGKGSANLRSIQTRLQRVNDELSFEVGESLIAGKKRLYLSADGVQDLFPEVAKLVEAAPTLILWEIQALRPAKEGPFIVEVDSLVLDAREVDCCYLVKDSLLSLEVYVAPELLYHPSFSLAFYLLLNALFGEYDATTKIRDLHLRDLEDHQVHEPSIKLSRLGKVMTELKQGLILDTVAVVPPLQETRLLREPYEVDEQYALIKGASGGEERQAMINIGYYYFQLKSEFPWRLCIETRLPQDMLQEVTGYDWEAWSAYERVIEDRLQQCCKAYYVFRSTSGNHRRTHFHVNRYQAALECMQSLQHAAKTFEFEFEFYYERDWETARSLLQHFVSNSSQQNHP